MFNQTHNSKMTKSILFTISFLFILSCQDELLDPSVTKSVSNENFKLSMTISDDIVHEDGNIKVDVSLERTVDAPFFLPNKMLGEWYLREMDGLPLEEDSLQIVYKFLADSTFGISKTFSFNSKSLGSQVLGKWNVSSDSDYQLVHGYDTTTTVEVTLNEWSIDDTMYSVTTQDIIHIDSIRVFEYTFSNDYGLTLTDKIKYNYMTVNKIDTSYEVNSTVYHTEFTWDTTYSIDSMSTYRDGLWDYSHDNIATLTIHFYDIQGGEHNTFATTFDIDVATIPVGSFMYWNSDNSHSVVLQKTNSSTIFNTPDDSTASFQGGWTFSQSADVLTVTTTLNNEEETGNISFDTPGSVVPEGGYMYWTTNENQYTFEKKNDPGYSDPNFENLDMDLIVSALGGDILVLNSTFGSEYKSFEVEIGSATGEEFNATCFFEPSSSAGSNGYISTQFNDLTLTISIYIIQD